MTLRHIICSIVRSYETVTMAQARHVTAWEKELKKADTTEHAVTTSERHARSSTELNR